MATMKQLIERRKMIEAKTAPLIEQRNGLALQAAEIEKEMEALSLQVKAINGKELFEINQEIAELARASGAKSMREA